MDREFALFESPFYKTMLCAFYYEQSECLRGAKCQFAHGEEELRLIFDPIEDCVKIVEKKH